MTRIAPLVAIALLGFAACSGTGSPCHAQCGANSSCNAATAMCACNPGFTSCGGACISLSDDRHNCGSCGKDCGGLDCVAGTCGCGPAFEFCLADGGPGADGGVPFCADVAHDIDNCGACGSICGEATASPAARAAAWQCFSESGGPGFCTCNGHYQYCQVSSSAPQDCIDVSADSQNCGACGHVCTGGLCKADVCNCSRPGYVACATTTEATDPHWCHLPLTTDQHCGDSDANHCGIDCTKAHSVCSAGTCVCAPGFELCPVSTDMQCVDIANDRYDCGSCGHLCNGGNCANQLCDCTYAGYVACATTTSTSDPEWCHLPELSVTHCGDTDPSHCGFDCTSTGVSTAFCSAGQCGCLLHSGDAGTLCPPDGGLTGFCADVLNDPLNCGGCYAPIFGPFDTCSNGLPSCDLGETLCALADASFCTNINRGDPAHCGACSGAGSSDCDTWNGLNSICESSSCRCAPDVTTTNGGKPDGGPASYCILSASQGQCSCNASQVCANETAALSWGHDIFPLFQTETDGTTSASKLGCSASGCHAGGEKNAAGYLDLSDLDAGYTGLMTGPIFGGKTCMTPPAPDTTGTFDCPCVAAALPDPKDPTHASVLATLLINGTYPQKCGTTQTHTDPNTNQPLVFSPCAQWIIADWIDAGAPP